MRWTQILKGLTAAAIAGTGGCTVGPDYHPNPPPVPAAWSSTPANGLTAITAAESAWWTSFNDAELDSLIQRAAQSNLDLLAAEARLRQARAVREMGSADLWPTLDASGSAARAKQSKHQPLIGALPLPPNFPFEYSVYQAGFDASWEVDLFGAKRRALEASTAEWEGATEARNDALLSLIAEVARNYVELRGGQLRLDIARRDVGLQKEALELTRARFKTGVTSELDVTRAASLLAGMRASVPPLETAVRGAMYALAVLVGREPGDLVVELSPAKPLPPVPPEIPIGLPSDLLSRRPDVRRAERQLAAETARVGLAKSDWFPKLSLTGDAGLESVSLGKFFEPGSVFWSVGPNLQWRALDFGRVRAEVGAQTAVQEAALANYEKAVLTSLQEAENAITAYAQEHNRRLALAEELSEDRRSLDMANGQYSEGRVNYLDVLDAQRSLYQSEDQLAASDQAVALDLIALYKALGGGWETPIRKPAPPVASSQ
jgi:NodT family efflux transporter outer membrane factor (OMF) lipoprotein